VATIRPRLAAGLCITALVYSGVIAARFSATYIRVGQTPSFLRPRFASVLPPVLRTL
jgi:hypothetical protein